MIQSRFWYTHALLLAVQSAELDRATIVRGTPGFTLMQRAGAAVVACVQEKYASSPCLILCGPGNNGGDGLVIAELLRRQGYLVQTAMLTPPEKLPGDAALARDFYQGEILSWSPSLLNGAALVIDALFGVGLDRPLDTDFIAVIEAVNNSALPVIAVDLPSGIHADTGQILGAAMRATATVTFTRKKPGLLLLPGRDYAGEVTVAGIGMDADALAGLPLLLAENHPDLWRDQLPEFRAGQHKYHHGHALILGGAIMTGAARLAARAAQRIGTGLVTIAAPPEAQAIYATNLDSVLVQLLTGGDDWRKAAEDPKKTAILLGPGAGVGAATCDKVRAALLTKKPCVLDADALTSFAEHPGQLFDLLHTQCVLTPHMGEFERLFDKNADKPACARHAAQTAQAVVLLKGADTIVAAPDGRTVINVNAPPWLATAGSGDVLAGIITGLMAQKIEPFTAACIGAWLHGEAARNFSPGMIAEDLIAALPGVLAQYDGRR